MQNPLNTVSGTLISGLVILGLLVLVIRLYYGVID
jgi:hypothetical protein